MRDLTTAELTGLDTTMLLKIATVPAMIALIAAMVLPFPAAAADHDSGQIRVTGVGEVYAAPDMATVSLGVVTEAKTASGALGQNSEIIAELITALKAEGIAARDLQTSGISVQPVYSRPSKSSSRSEEAPKIVGYTVRNTLTVRIRDLDRTGTLLDKMISLGSNTMNGITFGIAEPKPLQNEARKAAVADAREKAELYAEAAGVELGDIKLITEPQAQPPRPVAIQMRAAVPVAESAVPVEAGELSVSARIEIVWEIDD